LALTGIAAITGLLIARHHAHQQAVEQLEGVYKDLIKTINDLKLSGDQHVAKLLADTSSGVQTAKKFVDDYVNSLKDQQDANLLLIESGQGTVEQNVAAKDSYDALQKRIEFLSGTTEQETAAQKGIQAAFSDSRVDADKLAAHIEDLRVQYTTGAIGAKEYFDALANLPNVTADYAKAADAATGATADLGAAQQDVVAISDEAAKAIENFNKQVNETEAAALAAIGGLTDIAPAIDGMQTGFGRAHNTVEGLTLILNRLGEVKLTGPEVEALKVAASLKHIETQIASTEQAIQQNADDMSVWAGRIQLVDDTLGTAADGYANLNKLVADGKLTQ
jgi:hypothetical protein